MLEPTPLRRAPTGEIAAGDRRVPTFLGRDERNLDPATVRSFGDEWQRFDDFSDDDIERDGREYFADLLPDADLHGARVLDLGCGSGRWTRYFARRAGFVEAADPSAAALVATRATAAHANVRVIQAGVSSLPFADGAFDVIASVGVLHHVPDTRAAISDLARYLRRGGVLYLYLYYDLEDRPWHYRAIFQASQLLRRVISQLPARPKALASDAAAVVLYLPWIAAATAAARLAPRSRLVEAIPLHYYVGKPWKIVRNDALDRFGTPLERRFSRDEIGSMLRDAGFADIRFGASMPKWRVVARKAT